MRTGERGLQEGSGVHECWFFIIIGSLGPRKRKGACVRWSSLQGPSQETLAFSPAPSLTGSQPPPSPLLPPTHLHPWPPGQEPPPLSPAWLLLIPSASPSLPSVCLAWLTPNSHSGLEASADQQAWMGYPQVCLHLGAPLLTCLQLSCEL